MNVKSCLLSAHIKPQGGGEREREIESERLGSMDVIRPYAGERERETENDRERERVRVRNTAREGSE